MTQLDKPDWNSMNVPLPKTADELWAERIEKQDKARREMHFARENYFRHSRQYGESVDRKANDIRTMLPQEYFEAANFKMKADNSAWLETLPENFQQEATEEQKGEFGVAWFNPYEQKMVYGLMSANEALFMHTGLDHATGLANRNARNLYLRSSFIMNEDLRTQLGGVFLSEYAEDKDDIAAYRTALYNIEDWTNLVTLGDPGVKSPLLNNVFGSGVEDRFYTQPSHLEGENISGQMLEIFKTNAEDLYNNLVLNGIDVDNITKQARNTHEFMGIIMGAQAEQTIGLSLAYSEMTGGHTADTVWAFIRDSIIDDPDSAAELGIGLALSWTGVVPLAIAAVKAGKIAKKLYEFNKYMEKSRKLMTALRLVRQGHKVLPSQIPNTIMTKVLPDVAKLPWYAPKKLGIRSTANFVEGVMEGSAVSYLDQHHRIEYQGQEGYHLGGMVAEGLLEGIVSIGLNPTMGTVFGGSQAALGYTAGWVGDRFGPLATGSNIRDAVNLSLQLNRTESSDQFDEVIRHFHLTGEVKSFLSTELGRPITNKDLANGSPMGEAARFLLNTLDNNHGSENDPLMDIFRSYQANKLRQKQRWEQQNEQRKEKGLDPLPEQSSQPEDVMASLLRIGYSRQLSRGTATMDSDTFERFVQGKWINARIQRLADQAGMKPEEYREWLMDPDHQERLIGLVPDELQMEVRRRVGEKETSWETVNDTLNQIISERFAAEMDQEAAGREADEEAETAVVNLIDSIREKLIYGEVPFMDVRLPSGRIIRVSNSEMEAPVIDTLDSVREKITARRDKALEDGDSELVDIFNSFLERFEGIATDAQATVDSHGMDPIVQEITRLEEEIEAARQDLTETLAKEEDPDLRERIAYMEEDKQWAYGDTEVIDTYYAERKRDVPPHIQRRIKRLAQLQETLEGAQNMLEDAGYSDIVGGPTGSEILAQLIGEERGYAREQERYDEAQRRGTLLSPPREGEAATEAEAAPVEEGPKRIYQNLTKRELVDRLIERGLADESQRKSLMRENKNALMEGLEDADAMAIKDNYASLKKKDLVDQLIERELADESQRSSLMRSTKDELIEGLTDADMMGEGRDLEVSEFTPTATAESIAAEIEAEVEAARPEPTEPITLDELLDTKVAEAVEGDAELEAKADEVRSTFKRAEEINAARTEKIKAREELELKMKAVETEHKTLHEELLGEDSDYRRLQEIGEEQAALISDANQTTAKLLGAERKLRSKSKTDVVQAKREMGEHNRTLRDLQKQQTSLGKEKKQVEKRLKKTSTKYNKMQQLKSELSDLVTEWDNWGMQDILQAVEHYEHGLRYKAFGLISQNLKLINAKWTMVRTNTDTHFETNTTISKKELARELYGDQENSVAQLNHTYKKIKDKKDLTQKEATEVLRRWRQKQEMKALDLKGARDAIELTGDEFAELAQVQSNNMPGEHIDDIDPDNNLPVYVQSSEDAAKNSEGWNEKVHATTRANEAVLLKQAFNLLAYLKNTRFGSHARREGAQDSTGQESKVGTAGEKEILSCLPPQLQDIGPHILFNEAITNKEQLGEAVGDHNRHLARYDVDMVTDIVFTMIAEATAGDKGRAASAIEASRTAMADPTDPYSDFDVYGSIAEIEADMLASQEIWKIMNEKYGYALTLDRTSGKVTALKRTREQYETQALASAVEWMVDHTSLSRLSELAEEFGVNEKAIRNKFGGDPESQKEATSELIEEVVITFLQLNDLELGDWGGTAAGRTQVGWQPANELGMGIATLLSGKAEGTTYARAIDPSSQEVLELDGRATERTILNDSLKPTDLVPGELNHFAPNKTSVLRKLKEDFKIRARIRHIINHDLTAEEVQEFFDWASDLEKEGLLPEEFLGDVPMGMSLVAQISNRTPMTAPADLQRKRQILLESVIDMPHALYSFIHDSQTIANGQKLFFKTPMELFAKAIKDGTYTDEAGNPKERVGQLTEEEKQEIIENNPRVALYHGQVNKKTGKVEGAPQFSAGTPTGAVSLAGIAYVMGWERTYPALDGLSEVALEEGISYLEEYPGTPLENLYSEATYFDKSFNGKHHFHAMLLDINDDSISKDLNRIADMIRRKDPTLKDRSDYQLKEFETDEYIETSRLVRRSLDKIIKDGPAEDGAITEEEIEHLKVVRDLFYFGEDEGPFNLSDDVIADKYEEQRAFWKMPIMVRLYSAGQPAIRREIEEFSRTRGYVTKGMTSGVQQTFTKFLVGQGILQRNVVLDEALRMGGDEKISVMKLLKKDLGPLAKQRLDELKRSAGQSIEIELDPTTTLKDRLDQRIRFIAAMTGKSEAEVRKHFQKRLDKANKFLEDRGVSSHTHLSPEEMEQYQQILCYDADAWRNMPFLRNLNMMGGTGHRIDKTSRVEQETSGWLEVTDSDLMMNEDGTGGVMDQLWYHTFAPDLAGNRTHSTRHDGFQTQGTEFGRVRSEQNKHGMWNLEHNSVYKVYTDAIKDGDTEVEARAKAQLEMDKLLVKDLSIKLAGAAKPRFGKFEDKTDSEFLTAWESRSEIANDAYQKAKRKEESLKSTIERFGLGHEQGAKAAEALERMRKNHGLPSERAFIQEEDGLSQRHTRIIDTSNPAGLAAFRPKMASVNFHDRGNLMLRKLYWERKKRNLEEAANRREEMIASGRYAYHGESLFPKESRGFSHMYDMDTLPFIPDGNFDFRTELLMDQHIGHSRLKARAKNSLIRFAKQNGLEHWLTEGRVADLWILMRVNTIKSDHAWRVAKGQGRYREVYENAEGMDKKRIEQMRRERDRRAYLDDFWSLFRTQHDAENFESRLGEMFPSGGIPATKPGLFNPDIYRKEKARLLKDGKLEAKEIETLARQEASKPEHNTYMKIWGRYNEPTNNLKALTMSLVPNEHIILVEGEAGGGIDLTELAELPLSVQGNDIFDIMNYQQANEDVRKTIDELVAEGLELTEAYEKTNPGQTLTLDKLSDPHKRAAFVLSKMESISNGKETDIPLKERLWEIRDADAMREVHRIAKDRGAFTNLDNFNLYVYADSEGSYRTIVTKEEILDPAIPRTQSPKAGGERRAGPLGGRATKVKGSLWRFRLTPEGAFLMMNGINNIRAQERLELATIINTTVGEETALSEKLTNRPFFNQRNEEAILADVLDELTREFSNGEVDGVRKVTHGYQGYRGQQLKVLDSMSYLFPSARRRAPGQRELHVEADLLPLRKVQRLLNKLGQTEEAANIQKLIDSDVEAAVALGILLRFEAEANKTIKNDIESGILPEELTNESITPEHLEIFVNLENTEAAYVKAVDLLQRINAISDRGVKDNPWYFRVRNRLESNTRIEIQADKTDPSRGMVSLQQPGIDTLAEDLGATTHADRIAVRKAVLQMVQHDHEFGIAEGTDYAWLTEVDPFEMSSDDGFRTHFNAQRGDARSDPHAMRIADQIESLRENGVLTEEQADIARLVISQAIIKNPAIIENLHLASDKSIAALGQKGSAHFKEGKYLITFDETIESTPDLIDVISHELAHIGVMKFIREGGMEWAQAEAILNTARGKEMMWEFVKTFHGGRMTTEARQLYDRYTENPEEFMVQYTSYVMQRDSLYNTGALRKIETKYRPEVGALKAVLRKIGGFYSKLLHDIQQVFDLYKETDSVLYDRMERLASRIQGLALDKSAIEALDPTVETERFIQIKPFVHEGTTHILRGQNDLPPGAILNDTNPAYLRTLSEKKEVTDLIRRAKGRIARLKALDPRSITAAETTELRGLETVLADSITKKAELDRIISEGAYGVDQFGLTREKFEGGLDRIRRNAGEQDPDTGEWTFHVHKLDGIEDQKVYMSYILRNTSLELGDKISENLAGLIRHGFGNGWGKDILDQVQRTLLSGTKAGHTFLSPNAFFVLLSSMVEDGGFTSTNVYHNKMGVKSLASVRVQMDRIRSRIKTEGEMIWAEFGDNAPRVLKAANLMSRGLWETNQIPGMSEAEIQAAKDYNDTYQFALDLLYQRAKDVGLVSQDPSRTPSTPVVYKIKKEVNVTPGQQKTFLDKMAPLIADQLRLENSASRLDHITLFLSDIIPNHLKFVPGRPTFGLEWDAMMANDPEIGKYLEDQAFLNYVKEQDPSLETVDAESLLTDVTFEEHRQRWYGSEDGTILPIVDNESKLHHRKRTLSNILHRARHSNASIDTVFENASTEIKLNIMHRYNDAIDSPSELVQEKINWTRLHRKTFDSYLGYKPFSEEFQSDSLSDAKMPITSPQSWHTATFYSKAISSAFAPYDSEFYPSAEQINADAELAGLFEVDLSKILTGFITGLGTDASQRQLLKTLTKSNISFPGLLDMIGNIAEKSTLYDNEGNPIQGGEGSNLQTSLDVQRRKYNIMTGIGVNYVQSGDRIIDALGEHGQDMIRLVYGSNLGTAITMVEGNIVAANQLIQMHEIGNFVTTPLRWMQGLSKAKRMEMAEEIAYLLSHTSRDLAGGDDPYLNEVLTEDEKASGLMSKLQRGHMAVSKYADLQARVAASLTGRRFVLRKIKNGSLEALIEKIESTPQADMPKSQNEWKGFLRDIKGLGVRNHRIVLMLKKADLLSPRALKVFKSLLTETGGYDGAYSLIDISTHIMGGGTTDVSSDTEEMLSILSGLDRFDKEFTSQYLIDHRVMDSATDPTAAAKMINAYRNFPYSFAIQRMIRDSSNMSIHGFLAKQLYHLIWDALYMSILQVAAGRDLYEIIEEWKERPIGTALKYIARYPGFGPWGGFAAQIMIGLLQTAITGKNTNLAQVVPIQLAAWTSVLQKLASGDMSSSEGIGETFANLSRLIPGFGEALPRAGYQLLNNALHGDIMGSKTRPGRPRRIAGPGRVADRMRQEHREAEPNPMFSTPASRDLMNKIKNKGARDHYWDGSDTGLLMGILNEMSRNNINAVPLINPVTGEEAVKGFLGKNRGLGSESSIPQEETQVPQEPQTAPEPSQVPSTPQASSTSETAPEPSQARTKDPVGTLGGETVKEAPPEIFT